MSKLSTAIKLIRENRVGFMVALLSNINFFFSDKLYLKLMFRLKIGHSLNLKSPRSFNEKLQWLKLYDRNPLYTTLVDKYAVKKWVADKIGEEHIIPTLGVWSNANDIDFDKLPNQFVLKTTNGGGGDVVICRDKAQFNKEKAVKHLNKGLKKNIYRRLREWPYKNVPPRIIAEKYMEDESGRGLTDYKFHTFKNKPKVLLVVSDRFGPSHGHFDYFAPDSFEQLDFCAKGGRPPEKTSMTKPDGYEEMIEIVKKLSEGITYVRVDLYNIKGKIYFSELTFFDGSGFDKFNPEKWDYVLGEWLELPSKKEI